MGTSSLNFISTIDSLLTIKNIPYWIFGGWAVDFYIGKVRRQHDDVDILIWKDDYTKIYEVFVLNGFREEPLYYRDEHTRFFLNDNQIDVIYIIRKENGDIVTPGRWIEWPYPLNTFHQRRYKIEETTASVVHPDCMVDTYQNFDSNSTEAKLKQKQHQDFEDLLNYIKSE